MGIIYVKNYFDCCQSTFLISCTEGMVSVRGVFKVSNFGVLFCVQL